MALGAVNIFFMLGFFCLFWGGLFGVFLGVGLSSFLAPFHWKQMEVEESDIDLTTTSF